MQLPLIALIHIPAALIGFILYFVIFVLSFVKVEKRKRMYLILTIANLIYWFAMILGAFWAKLAWGQYVFFDDIKFILSALIIVPFFVLNFWQKHEKVLASIGVGLIILNYVLPLILDSLHAHGI